VEHVLLLDLMVGILSEVFLGSNDSCPLRDFGLQVILLVLNPFLSKWSTPKLTTVDPTIIVYSPDLMVLLYGLLCPSTQLDPTVENALGADQRSGMIVGSLTSMEFKTLVEFHNGNFSFGSGTDANHRSIGRVNIAERCGLNNHNLRMVYPIAQTLQLKLCDCWWINHSRRSLNQ
jgi:hypothetical protein